MARPPGDKLRAAEELIETDPLYREYAAGYIEVIACGAMLLARSSGRTHVTRQDVEDAARVANEVIEEMIRSRLRHAQ